MPQDRVEPQMSPGVVVADRYRIGNILGRGGTAAVYEALDLRGGRIVAVKVMDKAPDRKRTTREQSLLGEAQMSMRLASPHVVRLFEVGLLPDGRPFLVMERLFGVDVAHRLLDGGPMTPMDACDIVLQTCHALAEAHRAGVVHRDVKPQNLFLSMRPDGTPHVKVLDFGLAMMISSDLGGAALTPDTQTWRVAGSPGYAAPEQIGSQHTIDERADIWALGIVLYELVLGRRPFEGATLIDTLIAAGSNPVPPMGPVPSVFEQIVRQCLEKDRERRFATVADLADALAPLASPVLADYPELVRIAGGWGVPSAESTQRIVVDDEPTIAGVVPSRANSALDGPGSGPISSRRPPPSEGTRTDASRTDAAATSSFVAQVMPAQSSPWPGIVAVAVAAALGVSVLVSRAHGAPAPPHRVEVRALPAPSSSSMLLGPLSKARHEGPGGWQAEPPANWQEVP